MTGRANVVTESAMAPPRAPISARSVCEERGSGERAFISAVFGARLVATATARGLAPARLWRRLGVTPEEVARDPLLPVPMDRHLGLWQHVLEALPDPEIPFAYARQASIDAYGLLGLACKTAPDVETALSVVARFLPAYASDLRVALERRRAGALAVVLVAAGAPTLARRAQRESGLAEIWAALGELTGEAVGLPPGPGVGRSSGLPPGPGVGRSSGLPPGIGAGTPEGLPTRHATPFAPLAVSFTHRAPRDDAPHRSFFGIAPAFSAKEDALVLPRALLLRTPVRADAALHAYLVSQLASAAAAATSVRPLPFAERARAAVFQVLPSSPRAAVVARLLGVSVRTLQRRLGEESTSYEAVVDGARRGVAEALLEDPRATIAEVARATGFSEPSAFSRAFKRWTRRSPRRVPRESRSVGRRG